MSDLHAPWTFTQGNTDNPHNGEIRDARGHLIQLHIVMGDDARAMMHVMAAAPDMLAALKFILNPPDVPYADAKACRDREDKARAMALAAIAKAEGV